MLPKDAESNCAISEGMTWKIPRGEQLCYSGCPVSSKGAKVRTAGTSVLLQPLTISVRNSKRCLQVNKLPYIQEISKTMSLFQRQVFKIIKLRLLVALHRCLRFCLHPHLCFSFFIFTATSMACGSSQARGRIRAAPAGLRCSHSNAGSSHICDLCHSLGQCWILNPLSKVADGTRILMDTSQILNLLSRKGNSPICVFIFLFSLFFFLLTISYFVAAVCNSLIWVLHSQTRD